MTNCLIKDGGCYFNGNSSGDLNFNSFIGLLNNNPENHTLEICFKADKIHPAVLLCSGKNQYPGMTIGGYYGITGAFSGTSRAGNNHANYMYKTFMGNTSKWITGATQTYEFSTSTQKGFFCGEPALENSDKDACWCDVNHVMIGSRKSGSFNKYDYYGVIYNIRLYNRFLDDNEVKYNYNIDKQLFNIDS